jgi:hypothetical protein
VAQAKPKLRAPVDGPRLAMNCPSDTPVTLAGGALAPLPIMPEFAAAAPTGRLPVTGGGYNNVPSDGPLFYPIGGGSGGGGGGGIIVPPGGGEPSPPATAIPEPATWAQMLIGFGVIGGATRVVYRQEKKKKVDAEA